MTNSETIHFDQAVEQTNHRKVPQTDRSIPSNRLVGRAPIAMLGVPFDKLTSEETLSLIEQMIRSGKAHYAATANVDFAVQALEDLELRRLLVDADLVLCDGMPLVWASRFLGNPLPERVAGSDLVPQLLGEAEKKGWRVFFLGGSEDSVARAAHNVKIRHPGLNLVGAYSPPFKPLLEMAHEDILRRIRSAKPDILLVAFGCPKQEKWIGMHFRSAGVPFTVGVGATIDFLAGSMRRAPVWMQLAGLEWVHRLLQEPRRLFRRYSTDLWVFGRAILKQWWHLRHTRSRSNLSGSVVSRSRAAGGYETVRFSERMDSAAVEQSRELWDRLERGEANLLIDASRTAFIDSTGVGLLVRLQKQARSRGRQMILVAPSNQVLRSLALMRFTGFFAIADTLEAAVVLVEERLQEQNVVVTLSLEKTEEPVAWQGDIGASNETQIADMTLLHIKQAQKSGASLSVNLSAVRFIDSTGVRLMVRLLKDARVMGVRLRFTEPSPAVRNVLRILKMESFLLR